MGDDMTGVPIDFYLPRLEDETLDELLELSRRRCAAVDAEFFDGEIDEQQYSPGPRQRRARRPSRARELCLFSLNPSCVRS